MFSFCSNKVIRMFIFGDYEFLCHLYGISGQSGKTQKLPNSYDWDTNYLPVTDIEILLSYLNIERHYCLWCHVTQEELAVPRENRGVKPLRTLATLHTDMQSFEGAGANLRDAKYYNNMIALPLIEVPIDQVIHKHYTCATTVIQRKHTLHLYYITSLMQVAIPTLHISLGIFDHLYKLYEDACHELDVKLAAAMSAPVQATDTLMQYAAQIQENDKRNERILRGS